MDPAFEPIRTEINVKLGQGQYAPAVTSDVAAVAGDEPALAQRIDAQKYPGLPPVTSYVARAEATPPDLIAWTEGRALIATGSPFAPVTYRGVTYVVAHVNNALLYPGLGLGAIVSRARRISDGMFMAAASAVSSLVTVRQPGASLLPHIDNLRSASATVAVAVAGAANAEGLARVRFDDIVQQVQDAMWQPEYRRIQAS